MDADLDTLVTALYVRVDDLLKAHPDRVPWRPLVGIAPRISDAELVTLAVTQALLGFTSEARWLRFARAQLRHLFPYLPGQPGYNKRLRKLAGTLSWLIGALAPGPACAATTCGWPTPPRWSAAVPGRPPNARIWPASPSTGTAPRHPATSGGCGCTCCARCTGCRSGPRSPAPRPTNAHVLLGMLDDARPGPAPAGQTLIADKNYYGREFETTLARSRYRPATPDPQGRTRARPANEFFKPLRQTIESMNDTLKGQLDLEHHGGAHHRRRPRPHLATRPGTHRRDLAQRQHRRTRSNDH